MSDIWAFFTERLQNLAPVQQSSHFHNATDAPGGKYHQIYSISLIWNIIQRKYRFVAINKK